MEQFRVSDVPENVLMQLSQLQMGMQTQVNPSILGLRYEADLGDLLVFTSVPLGVAEQQRVQDVVDTAMHSTLQALDVDSATTTDLVVKGASTFSDQRITHVATPVDGKDAVNKDYIDQVMAYAYAYPPSVAQLDPPFETSSITPIKVLEMTLEEQGSYRFLLSASLSATYAVTISVMFGTSVIATTTERCGPSADCTTAIYIPSILAATAGEVLSIYVSVASRLSGTLPPYSVRINWMRMEAQKLHSSLPSENYQQSTPQSYSITPDFWVTILDFASDVHIPALYRILWTNEVEFTVPTTFHVQVIKDTTVVFDDTFDKQALVMSRAWLSSHVNLNIAQGGVIRLLIRVKSHGLHAQTRIGTFTVYRAFAELMAVY